MLVLDVLRDLFDEARLGLGHEHQFVIDFDFAVPSV